MSGYALQVISVLIVNIVVAYAAYMPLACGQLNLGIAGFMAIGAYTSAVLSGHGFPLAPSIAGGALAATIAGLLISYPVLRARGIYLTIATLAFSEVIVAALLNFKQLGAANGLVVANHMTVGPMLWTLIIVLVLVAWLSSTRFGLVMTAIRNDGQGAAVFGVGVRRVEGDGVYNRSSVRGRCRCLVCASLQLHRGATFQCSAEHVCRSLRLAGRLADAAWTVDRRCRLHPGTEFLRSTDQWRYVGFGVSIILLMLLRPEGLLTRRLIHELPFRRRYA